MPAFSTKTQQPTFLLEMHVGQQPGIIEHKSRKSGPVGLISKRSRRVKASFWNQRDVLAYHVFRRRCLNLLKRKINDGTMLGDNVPTVSPKECCLQPLNYLSTNTSKFSDSSSFALRF
jgi:hypothetical protein